MKCALRCDVEVFMASRFPPLFLASARFFFTSTTYQSLLLTTPLCPNPFGSPIRWPHTRQAGQRPFRSVFLFALARELLSNQPRQSK